MRIDKRRTMIAYGVMTLICGVIAWSYSIDNNEVHLNNEILIPFSFIALGVLIKYGDQSYDSNCFSRRISNLLSVPCGLWMGGLIIFDPDTATIFIGMLLALLIASKYDNVAFKLGFGIAFIASVITIFNDPGNVSFIGIIVVFAAAFADEWVSDRADAMNKSGFLWTLMKERPVLKLAVLALCAMSILSSYLYFFAFLGFDLGYSFVAKYAEWRGCEPAKA
ncbi:MAG: hypothetical protein LLG16_04945 [Euryarchaeota archaeon]|nr:hypothetical protein [Euryarchaeota archaeon]